MCIDVKKVLNKMAPHAQHYQYPNPQTGFNETHYHLFNEAPKDDSFMSEDWGMVSLARELGIDMIIDTEVTIKHRGEHLFCAPPRPTKEQQKAWHEQQLRQQFEHYQNLKAMYEGAPVDATPNP